MRGRCATHLFVVLSREIKSIWHDKPQADVVPKRKEKSVWHDKPQAGVFPKRKEKSIWHDRLQAYVVPMPEMIVDWVYNKKDKQ